MKTCICCKQGKPISSFYKHKMMKDGYLNKCIECCKMQANKRRAEKLDEIRAYDRARGSLPHRLAANRARQKSEKGRVSHSTANNRYKERYKNRTAARYILSNALRDGKVKKMACFVCGDGNVEAHHPDYDRPLDVVWMCQKHHKETHKLANQIERDKHGI